jgi:RNA polymerase sigma factor (sigma-70 family)
VEEEEAGPADRSAAALARLYAHRVPRYVRQIEYAYRLGNRWSDDLTSAGYWGLAKALSNRREGALEVELSAYVSRRIRGAVIDEVRTCLTRDTRGECLVGDAEDAHAGEPNQIGSATANENCPERTAGRQRTRRMLETAIRELSEDQRRIARAFMRDKSWDEIAEDEGVSVSTVRSRFRTTALRLRKRVLQLMHPTR